MGGEVDGGGGGGWGCGWGGRWMGGEVDGGGGGGWGGRWMGGGGWAMESSCPFFSGDSSPKRQHGYVLLVSFLVGKIDGFPW